jgi:catechol 2,3-dioxygenase-like lactoylglutathione lyase family enzyme
MARLGARRLLACARVTSVIREVTAMLADAPVHAAIPASDLERAKRYYRDTLGLKLALDTPEGVRFDCGGTQLYLYPTPSAGQAAHTLASWRVDDLDAEMTDLRARGVTFEEYDLPGLKTVGGVAEWGRLRGCWFKDSEGNTLGVTEMRE